MTPMELGDYWDRGYIIDKPKKTYIRLSDTREQSRMS